MADRFRVTALVKRGQWLSVLVESIDPESGPPAVNESFVLMMLRERGELGELAKAVSRDDVIDVGWQEDWAHGFVSDVAAHDVVPGDKPKARLDITVTHAAWIGHVEKGDVWTTRARVIVSECEPCEPIAPAINEDTLLTGPIVKLDEVSEGDDAFLCLPRLVWGPGMKVGPELVEVPAYAPSAYGTIERIAKPRTIPADWIGRAVRVEAWSQSEDGALLAVDGANAQWATMSATAYGTGEGRLDALGLLALKAGRRGTKLTYAKALSRVHAQRLGMTILRGIHLTVRFRIPPGPFAIAFADAGEVIDFLAADLHSDDSPLRRALATDVVPGHYIAKYALDAPPVVDLDSLSLEQVRTALAGEWPTVTLRVTVTDALWLEHLRDHPPPASLRTILVER